MFFTHKLTNYFCSKMYECARKNRSLESCFLSSLFFFDFLAGWDSPSLSSRSSVLVCRPCLWRRSSNPEATSPHLSLCRSLSSSSSFSLSCLSSGDSHLSCCSPVLLSSRTGRDPLMPSGLESRRPRSRPNITHGPGTALMAGLDKNFKQAEFQT